jgi:beta-lactamase regulating signal transducer with metallopeptidase domain
MSTAVLASWLLTYLIHSTVLLGAAWLISRILGDRHFALQEILLRTALVGGVVTATAQFGLRVEPIGGAVAIGVTPATEMAVIAETGAAGSVVNPYIADGRHRKGIFWPLLLLSLWGIGSLAMMLTLGRSMIDLRRLLKTRRFRPTGRLIDRLANSLGLRRSVRLSTTAAIAVPFATGIRRPEICCPERVGELAPEHQKSLFAHELAHLARRDPAWQLLYRIGEALLFVQPLNVIVRRRLEEIAEHLTDARAVASTGDRLGLARCLVVVAHWGISASPGVPATAFAAGPRLDRRVRHLISDTCRYRPVARWVAPALMVLVLGMVVLLPLVTPSAAHADSPASDSIAEPTATWSTPSDSPGEVTPAPPASPAQPAPHVVPAPIAPATGVLPVPEVAPQSSPESRPISAPAPIAEPAPATAPEPHDAPEPATPPAPPCDAEEPATEDPVRSERERARERERASHRERAETAVRERERARALEEEARKLAAEARMMARETAERSRLTEAEREKLRAEATELERLARMQAREMARQSREEARLSDAQREEIRRRAIAMQAEARERARKTERLARERAVELAEQARLLAEQAEAERQREADRLAKEREKKE